MRGLFEAVDRATLQDQAYAQIRGVLMTGGIAPGEKVTIRGLADGLGMSWTPIREAVRRLAAEGALEVSPNRWIRVPKLSAAELVELKDVRIVVEGEATARAARRIGASEMAALWKLEEDIVSWRGAGDVKGMITRINRLHFAIYRESGMPTLIRIIEGLWLRTAPHVNLLFPAYTGKDRGQHRGATLKALAAGNAEAARASMERDIAGALDYLIDLAAADEAPAPSAGRKRKMSPSGA